MAPITMVRSGWSFSRRATPSGAASRETSVRLTAPAPCAGLVVLVERGWTPRNLAYGDRLPPLPSEPGDIVVMGHVEPAISAVYALGQEPDPPQTSASQGVASVTPIRQNAAPDFWSRWLARDPVDPAKPGAMASIVVRQHEPLTTGLRRDWAMGWQGTSPAW